MPNTGRRLLALADELERRDDVVVCLQEVQLNRYRKMLHRACRSFPHHIHEPYLQCPKGGLLTLARVPVTSTQFIPYTERGLWYTPMIMDRLLYKGMLVTTFAWAGTPVTVINTHILANYVGDWERRGMHARIEEKQLRQLAETVRSQPAETLTIVVGDFNIPRGSRLYRDFLELSELHDPLAGDTRPTHRPPFGVPSRYALPIDYVLVRKPSAHSLKIDCDLCFSNKLWRNGWRQDYLSDHNGISARLTIGA